MASLKALRAFTAVAEAGTVAAAADRLCVTPSALSHLLRDLERDLGATLLTREGRGLTLTEEGRQLRDGLGDAFDRIDRAVTGFRRRRAELRISTLSTFATRWLIPRLPAFREAHPRVELFLSTSTRMVDLRTESFDCAIRWGRGVWPGLRAELLWRETLTPVAAPEVAERIAAPRDLADTTLLHSGNRRGDWAHWLREAGATGIAADAGPLFDTRNLVIQAAVAGLGVAVIDPRFAEQEIAAGRLSLVLPGRTVARDTGYWLVSREDAPAHGALAAFRDWVVEDATQKGPDAPPPPAPEE